MGKNNLSSNPMDTYRKQVKKKEQEKQLAEKNKSFEKILNSQDPDVLLHELKKPIYNIDAAGKVKKKQLQSAYDALTKKNEPKQTNTTKVVKMDPALEEAIKKYGPPEESIYYDPVLNPYGIPPPGKPNIRKKPAATMPMIPPHHPQHYQQGMVPSPPPPFFKKQGILPFPPGMPPMMPPGFPGMPPMMPGMPPMMPPGFPGMPPMVPPPPPNTKHLPPPPIGMIPPPPPFIPGFLPKLGPLVHNNSNSNNSNSSNNSNNKPLENKNDTKEKEKEIEPTEEEVDEGLEEFMKEMKDY
ncbi:hypothetical protein CYY_000322 [Polysphondylium violaceum]|uniref:Wbp11/ELF5/Saf1 N-terminal domain-containing protein n=1 Tax=Polysphondylium violaceum TaxID=133409 RepID=A0A8J4Q1Q1_9MYCE|nr:hypothetical protein CYY_000322 [Polysphondylium violaceum]